jgi:hypothetical protein
VKFRLSFGKLLILANGIFWMAFAILFVSGAYLYRPHPRAFEEATPSYIFFGNALRQIETGTGVSLPPLLVTSTFAIQKPSVLAARPFYWYFDALGITVDHLYGGISVGGYYLLLVCLLSFVQWYLVGWVGETLWHKWSSRGTTVPSNAPSSRRRAENPGN